MTADGESLTQGSASLPAYRVGMEVDPVRFSPPEIRPGPPEWEPYRPPRFSTRTRVVLTVAIFAAPVFLGWAALVQILTGAGRERAAAMILLMPLVPAVPLLIRAWRDLWGSGDH